MWRAVIERAILDAVGKEFIEKRQAINWISDESLDFHTVCDFAAIEPTAVKRIFWELKNEKQERKSFKRRIREKMESKNATN
ncbi:MAG: hypothetical protein LBM19_01320 [Holosporales bacterium]|nr:hypothetical protein [Holosporales bacterium]